MRAGDLTLPKTIALPGTGQAVRAYPALVDEGETVGVRILDTPEAQALAMRAGTRRLLVLASRRHCARRATGSARAAALTLGAGRTARGGLEDARDAAMDALVGEAGGPAWDAGAFGRLRSHVAGRLVAVTTQVASRWSRCSMRRATCAWRWTAARRASAATCAPTSSASSLASFPPVRDARGRRPARAT